MSGRHGDRTHLAEVFPHDVQGAATDDRAVIRDGNTKLRDRLVKNDKVFSQKNTVVDKWSMSAAIAGTSTVCARRTVGPFGAVAVLTRKASQGSPILPNCCGQPSQVNPFRYQRHPRQG